MRITPFKDARIGDVLDNRIKKILAEIDRQNSEHLLNTSLAELENHYIAKVKFQPLTLYPDKKFIEEERTIQVDVSNDFHRAVPSGQSAHVPGTQLQIAIPYDGDEALWKVCPSSFKTTTYPEITIRRSDILLTLSFANDTSDEYPLQARLDRALDLLIDVIEKQRTDIERHNRKAPERIKARLKSKRESSGAAKRLVESLGIPIKRRDQPATYAAPVTRRPKIEKPKPSPATRKVQHEPVLLEEEYSHILSVLRSMSLVIERNPMSFSTLKEELIRDLFLLTLNGHYEGAATGETFNAGGKTDILIRYENRNVFIAECKFWKGPKGFNDAIDQLLGYLTWRDCKCSLMMFNRKQNSSDVLRKMHEAMEKRTECKKTVSHEDDGESRYIFVKESEPDREITITTMLFDVPGSDD